MVKEYDPDEPADEVTKMDNQSVIGGLPWLASQTRPDLQTGVSMAQRKQQLTYLRRREGDEQDRQDGPRVQGRGAEVPEGWQWQLGRLGLAGLP